MAIRIRKLGPGDAGVLARVADEVFDNPIDPSMAKRFLADPMHRLFVAIEAMPDDAPGSTLVVGFVSAVEYLHPDKRPQRWINELSVAPPWRRRGIASRLITAAVEDARSSGCQQIWLATERDNGPANGVYRSLGAKETPIVMYEFQCDDAGNM